MYMPKETPRACLFFHVIQACGTKAMVVKNDANRGDARKARANTAVDIPRQLVLLEQSSVART